MPRMAWILCYLITLLFCSFKAYQSEVNTLIYFQSLHPKIPKEFTNEGMLERLHVFTEHLVSNCFDSVYYNMNREIF